MVIISTQLKKTQKYLLSIEKNLALKFQICTNKIRNWSETTDIYCIQIWSCEPSASNLNLIYVAYGQLMIYQPEICQKPTKTEFPQNIHTQKYFQQGSALQCCKTDNLHLPETVVGHWLLGSALRSRQTNSKLFFQANVSSKKMNKQIRLYYLSTCFCSFFGRK